VNFIKSHPIFSTVMIMLTVFTAGELWFLLSLRKQEAALESETELKIGQINVLQRQRPAPTDDNVLLAQDDLEQRKAVLSTMLRSLGVTQQDELEYFKDEPADDITAFFDISGFVGQMHAEANEAGVQVEDTEQFGFATYENFGPDPGLIRIVYRQRRILQYLLERLIAAGPQALISVQREKPVAEGDSTTTARSPSRNQPSSRDNAPTRGPASDFFVIDPQVSARTPGYVDTMAFRIVFVGQSAALRGFMNALAEPGLPLVVRSVEVQTLGAESAGPGTRENSGNSGTGSGALPELVSANVPIVAENDAQFTVTVEMFEVMIQ